MFFRASKAGSNVLGLSANRASDLAKKPDAIRNLKRAVQNGDRRGVTTETLLALAPVLKTTAAWLLEGVGEGGSSTAVRVVGRIGAGAEILPEFEQIPPEGLFEIELPFPLPPDSVAFAVEGDSMWPRYDSGDVVICGKDAERCPCDHRLRGRGAHRRRQALSEDDPARRARPASSIWRATMPRRSAASRSNGRPRFRALWISDQWRRS